MIPRKKERGVRKMRRKIVYAMLAILALLSLICVPNVPTKAWVYPDCTQDTKYELFGPRLDQLLIKMYPFLSTECTAMEMCEIDVMDWPLTRPYVDKWSLPPYSDYIKMVEYGCDLDEIVLEMNNNPNQYLGNPPNPSYLNPVYPNPCSVSSFRHALAHLMDRQYIIDAIDLGLGIPMYTEVSPFLGAYQHPGIYPGGIYPGEDLTHPYNLTEAARLLDLDGFPLNPFTGWRYWDRNGDGKEGPDEYMLLKFVIRNDDRKKHDIASWYIEQLRNPLIAIPFIAMWMDRLQCINQVMVNKDFHLYTGDRNLRKDPDYLYEMKHSQMYWHPGICPNYMFFNDTLYDYWAEQLKWASDYATAQNAAYMCQEVYATPCKIGSIPIECRYGIKAMKRCYSGTPEVVDEEDRYETQLWKGFVNGYWAKCSCGGAMGINSWWTFLNAYPEGHLMGDCKHMTIRYGFSVPALRSLNPIYANDYWEWEVLNKIYDTLLKEDPYTLEDIPWIAKNWEIGTWRSPIDGIARTKIKLTLDTCKKWQDGIPFSAADVIFTMQELPKILAKRGLPPPWWHQKVKFIHNVNIIDPCNIEILFDVQSIWALHWIGELKILPKHIWKPIVETGDPTGFAPDPNLIGCGPWRLVEYVDWSHVLLVANKPSSTVKTNLPGSTSIHSPYGYFRWCPVHTNIHTLQEFHNKDWIDYTKINAWNCTQWNCTKGEHKYIGTQWHLTWGKLDPTYDTNNNSFLDQGDYIDMTLLPSGPTIRHHVYHVEMRGGLPPPPAPPVFWPPCNVTIWTDWYSQKIYPCDDAAFGIELHNEWLDPIPNTAWPYHEQVGELWVDKIVKLSVEQIIPYESGTIFPAMQYLHFQNETKIHLQTDTKIHFLTAGTIVVNDALVTVVPSMILAFPASTVIVFPVCMAIEFLVETGVHWLNAPIDMQIKPTENIVLKACQPHKEIINLHFKKCHYDIKVLVHVKGPEMVPVTKEGKVIYVPNPWICQWINCTYDFWSTIPPDIAGKWWDTWHEVGWYGLPPAGHEIQIPDCKVDMKDVFKAARAFGSYPCHPRWEAIADLNGDYKVDMKDVYLVARNFGWKC